MQIKIKKIIITVIVICAIGIPLGMRIYNKSAVEFKDENMKKVMASKFMFTGYFSILQE